MLSLLTHDKTEFWAPLHDYDAWPQVSVLHSGALEAPCDVEDDIYNGRSEIECADVLYWLCMAAAVLVLLGVVLDL